MSTRMGKWSDVARSPMGASAVVMLSLLAVLAVVGPVIWGEAAERIDVDAINDGPSSEHFFGTDNLGRDLLARVLVAARFSLGLALLATVIGLVLGLAWGMLPVVLSRRAGRLLVAAIHIAVAFPGLLLVMFFAVIFGVGAQGAVLAISIGSAPSFARLVHTLGSSIAGRDFVAAARIVGVGRFRLVTRHVLPNIAEPLLVNITMAAGGALLAFAGLSFLGIGVQPPYYDWGRLLNEGLDHIYVNPAAALAPCIVLVFAGLAFALLGETLAQVAGLRAPLPKPAGRIQEPAVENVPRAAPADAAAVVDNLRVSFPTTAGWVKPVDGVSLVIEEGETVGLVGESGSGKSLTALGVAALAPEGATVTADRMDVLGKPLLNRSDGELRELLGTSLVMVFQDPVTSLNPSMRVGSQLGEIARVHQRASRSEAFDRAVDRLRAVRISAAKRRARQYPHEFSGGMRQRAMVAMGLMGNPRLIIADEPTTALDVTVQRQVLALLQQVQTDTGAAILLISHDIAVVSQMCSRILVMYAGRIVEELPSERLLSAASHPYTRALLGSVPDMKTARNRPLTTIPGRPPEPSERPHGCAFAPRCTFADDQCHSEDPVLLESDDGGRVACWHPRSSPTHLTAPATLGGPR